MNNQFQRKNQFEELVKFQKRKKLEKFFKKKNVSKFEELHIIALIDLLDEFLYFLK